MEEKKRLEQQRLDLMLHQERMNERMSTNENEEKEEMSE